MSFLTQVFRSVFGRELGLDVNNNLVLGGKKIFFNHDSGTDGVLDLSSLPQSGGQVVYASPAGASNNVNPGGGFPAGIGVILVTLAGGNANWTGLAAGANGQQVLVINNDGANQLTLNNTNGGSAAANQFFGTGDLPLPKGARTLLTYLTALNGGNGAWSMG